MATDKEEIVDWFKKLQDSICRQLEEADGEGRFREDLWEREGGGGGRTRVITNGNIIEKGGVNFSAVFGSAPDNIVKALNLPKSDFFASGVSIVLHPVNPMVPIIHMNVRYFETSPTEEGKVGTWWFGGGIDLTPHYVDREDAKYFHQQLKSVCDNHDHGYYPQFKKWADDYFYIKHRQETRGIGGIFFDRLGPDQEKSKEQLFSFVKDVGSIFAPVYTHFMNKNCGLPFGEKEKQWQMLRRGRYVEFNLVWDKGTKFGLDTNGRTESILMSLPPQANWVYDYQPTANSSEEQTLRLLKKDINWLG
ncbi:Coproporphyrinogen III oxidase, aerobic [Fulvivirga imtechensis AK7]|uniref:coproporphyrinogen oxidase n=1 Tax=Fulvivirga imtechensis AK7 TaxID=1237149 RepID=L8JUD9_9BACT|nr:oxygen-dependent coproporphyrinogen oxidase [Fulvivirga imtechensis]ELR70907.1 Coproporphyrinogen III oxidase, aerobic [Fulvivirga imtechensis AK7]